ncbi:transport protein [Prevotella intermedia]|uniref:Transport protein n=1 Tax=Prevotella intermedia TaxID=28131 RepID=A0AAD1BKZ2_PREIN|nr:mechanosensitive ion channel domain-containing protein [Prevotella intermedia]AFJ07977.1 transporter, small conductance mechanosensitive ion channel MscS family protein [Prevotella intermedia 17]APW34085.1 mechanosensitive ion channel protein [Prevotella intermedia]BAR96285.1 transport protein [Prevotella intermedia]
MEIIITFIENLLLSLGLEGTTVAIVRYVLMIVIAFLLAGLSGYICRKFIVPLIIKLTSKTNIEWDDILFDRTVLYTACNIVPAIVIWKLLPKVFFQYPLIEDTLVRLTAIYIAINATRLVLQIVDRIRFLRKQQGNASSQYLRSFLGVLKIIVFFIAVIIVVSILFKKNPMTLLAGLGATSAILMLVFKDTIEGLVAGIRLTSNEMVHVGDWITVPGTPVDGNVVDITLTTVKVRQFDNTYTTVSPLTLVNGSFKNWKGMQDSGMRQVSKKIYFDVRSIRLLNDETRQNLTSKNMVSPKEMEGEVVNIGLFRHYIDTYLRKRDDVNKSATLMVRQLEATQNGLPIELYFFLETTDWVNYEQKTSDILEHIYAYANEFGLQIYEGFAAINK